MRISDWSSDVCSSDLAEEDHRRDRCLDALGNSECISGGRESNRTCAGVTEQSARMLEVARASALAIQEGPVDGHQSRIICYRGELRRSEHGQSPPATRRSRSEAQAVRFNIDLPFPQSDIRDCPIYWPTNAPQLTGTPL